MNLTKNVASFLCAIMLMLTVLTINAFANTDVGSAKITHKYNNTAISDASFNLYYIATKSEKNDKFSDCNFDFLRNFTGFSESEYLQIIDYLQEHINENEILPDMLFKTGASGVYNLTDIPSGWYYIKIDNCLKGSNIYIGAPILFFIDAGEVIEILPKVEHRTYSFTGPTSSSSSSSSSSDYTDDTEEDLLDEGILGDAMLPDAGTHTYRIPLFAGCGMIFILVGVLIKPRGGKNGA